jgi:hypothetical protein
MRHFMGQGYAHELISIWTMWKREAPFDDHA